MMKYVKLKMLFFIIMFDHSGKPTSTKIGLNYIYVIFMVMLKARDKIINLVYHYNSSNHSCK